MLIWVIYLPEGASFMGMVKKKGYLCLSNDVQVRHRYFVSGQTAQQKLSCIPFHLYIRFVKMLETCIKQCFVYPASREKYCCTNKRVVHSEKSRGHGASRIARIEQSPAGLVESSELAPVQANTYIKPTISSCEACP